MSRHFKFRWRESLFSHIDLFYLTFLYPRGFTPKGPLETLGDILLSGDGSLVSRDPFSQFSSVVQLCLTLCDPMNRSTPGLPVHHQVPEFIQTRVHQVSDAIQPSHPLWSPSPPAPNPSQHHGLFQ